MNGITSEQIEFLRNKLPEIVREFNEKNNCNTKIFEWTKLHFKDGSLQSSKLITIENLLDPLVEKLEFAQAVIFNKKLLTWVPVFAGDTMYYLGHAKVIIKPENYSRLELRQTYILCQFVNSNKDSFAVVQQLAISDLHFDRISKTLSFGVINPDGKSDTLSIPRPIKNTDTLEGDYWYTTVLGNKYYFLTEEDRNNFIKTIQKSLEYLKVEY